MPRHSDIPTIFEVDRGIPKGLIMQDMLRRSGKFGLGDFGIVPEPFPDWYGAMGRSASTTDLRPIGTVPDTTDSAKTAAQARDWAAAEWKAAKAKADQVKDAAAFSSALGRYRFAHDFAVWAASVGIASEQQTRVIKHWRLKIESARTALRTALGTTLPSVPSVGKQQAISPVTSVEAAGSFISKEKMPETVTLKKPFDTKKILTIAGISLLGVVLFVSLAR